MTNKQVKMEQHVEEPRVCQEPDVLKTLRPDPAESPPPNCAICLGTCTNKCFTDCCLHQFCFSCLLEWSKIKAECPLCKQPFKSIIYNIKSNLEYEEHIITNPERENQEELLTLSDPSEYLFLPNGPRPQRHFQYRTTFTLEPGGEFAIQQLLLSHPRTNSISFPSDRYPYIRFNSSSTHSVDQRRTIYIENWWVDPQSDVTGRFRVCSPHFFRENPAQAHRIIPWLNRELTSLINHTLIYPVQQEILDMICQYPILSSQFRSHIVQHLGARTDHFIHEFYNFVRSPYDMIGYDRHATYRRNRPPPIYDLSDEDSDVHVVDSPENDDCVFIPNRTPEVIVIDSESSGNDSDVIMRTPTPPPIVDLVNDSSTEEEHTEISPQQQQQQQQHHQQQHQQTQQQHQQTQQQQPHPQEPVLENDRIETRSPQLPIKIRLKRSKSSAEICKNYKHKEKRRLKRSHSSSSTSSENNSSSTESYNSSSKSSSDYYKYVMKKKKSNRKHNKSDSKYLSKNSKYRCKKSETKVKKSKRNSNKKSKKQKKSKRRDSEKRHKNVKIEKSDTSTSPSDMASSCSDDDENYHRRKKPKLFYEIKTEGPSSSTEQTLQNPQIVTSQYEQQYTENYANETEVSTSPSTAPMSPSTVATFPSSTETSLSPTVAAASTFSSTNVETNSDHWSTTSIASSCPSSNVPQDLGVAGPSNGVSVQSMVVVKDKDGSLWCRGNYQPSKRFGLYRPDLNRSSDNSSDSD